MQASALHCAHVVISTQTRYNEPSMRTKESQMKPKDMSVPQLQEVAHHQSEPLFLVYRQYTRR